MVIFFLLWLPLVQAQNCGDLQDPIAREVVRELHEGSFTCAPNNVHLTFDDGPAASVTPELLRALRVTSWPTMATITALTRFASTAMEVSWNPDIPKVSGTSKSDEAFSSWMMPLEEPTPGNACNFLDSPMAGGPCPPKPN
jgi:hypothetical protein